MSLPDLLSHFAVALGIGLLIGLERGWTRRGERSGRRAAGLRTFAISGLLGGCTGAAAQALGGVGGAVFLGLGFIAYAITFTIFCLEENRATQSVSATTAIAGLLTFGLAAFALIGDMRVAAAIAVIATILLALREPLHGWLRNLTEQELRSALILLAMTFIALPVLPSDPIGPFGGINLRETWIIAIVLTGVSFLGYVAVKYLGAHHGILVAAAAGGLASSTAVTISNARRAVGQREASRLLAAGVALATAVSFVRVLVIAAALNPRLLPFIGAPLIAATIAAVAFSLILIYGRSSQSLDDKTVQFRNPFSIWSVLSFAFLLAIIILFGRALGEYLGAAGAIAGAFVLGFADVDAVTVSMARLAPGLLDLRDAALAVLVAVIGNTIGKIGIGAAIGRGAFAYEIAAMAVLCLAAGGAAFWVMRLMAWI